MVEETVAVFGHLTYPPVQAFGEDWLAGSVSTVRFLKPAYDQDALSITMNVINRFHGMDRLYIRPSRLLENSA